MSTRPSGHQPSSSPDDRRRLALDLLAAAIEAAHPGPAVLDALREEDLPDGKVWVVAIGKAAPGMATAAVTGLARLGREPTGGLVVAPTAGAPPHPAFEVAVGDHPVPGTGSFDAARRLGVLTTRVAPADVVLVLLSGGATALVGAPATEVETGELVSLYDALLRSGAPIDVMNAIRKRFSRWGAGRLAAALAPATVRCLAVSDVAGDDPSAIGSGPCVPDYCTATELLDLIERHALRDSVSPALREHLALVARGEIPETPGPGDAAFARASTRVILDNRAALAGAASAARASGCEVGIVDAELAGDAAAAGRACATELLQRADGAAQGPTRHRPLCLLWGGETTVTMPPGANGTGGRCQELALAAAELLRDAGARGARVTLLAAGTDGRDGPTDAAGAVVDGGTWDQIASAGVDPYEALARHDSHRALGAAAGALVRTGHTGTNVRDVVIGLVS
ncbi:MAG TPA: DUF4147 domain-containing protein [Gemmatimonadales bacterium]